MQPQILIVENVEREREDEEDYVREMTPERRSRLRINHIDVVSVESRASATQALSSAVQPFDLVLVDLEIPEKDGERAYEFLGLKILTFVRSSGSAKEAIVVSGKFHEKENIPESVRNGAADLVFKGRGLRRDIQEAVFRSLERTVTRDCTALLAERVRLLVPFAERGLVYYFGTCFSRCIQEVGRAGNNVRAELLERLGLDSERDKADMLMQRLAEIDSSLESGRTEWGRLQSSLGLNASAEQAAVSISNVIAKLETKLEPCLIVKNVTIKTENLPDADVLSFSDDVCAVVEEMIRGGLADLPEFGEKTAELVLTAEVQDDWVELFLADDFEPLKREELSSINDGIAIGPDARFSRAWGLSVMQYVALQGGGRLTVESHGAGNRVKYRIPRVRRA